MLRGVHVHFVSHQDYESLTRGSLFDLINPGFGVFEGLSVGYIICDDGTLGISDVHTVQSHSLLISRDIPDA
jgi:hypothetical protein